MGKQTARLHRVRPQGLAPVQSLVLQPAKGPGWHQREGLERGREEEEDVLVNPTVVGAPSASRWEDLGNFQMWVHEVEADGDRQGVRSLDANRTYRKLGGADARQGCKPEAH